MALQSGPKTEISDLTIVNRARCIGRDLTRERADWSSKLGTLFHVVRSPAALFSQCAAPPRTGYIRQTSEDPSIVGVTIKLASTRKNGGHRDLP
jgi:hypothetical protein